MSDVIRVTEKAPETGSTSSFFFTVMCSGGIRSGLKLEIETQDLVTMSRNGIV